MDAQVKCLEGRFYCMSRSRTDGRSILSPNLALSLGYPTPCAPLLPVFVQPPDSEVDTLVFEMLQVLFKFQVRSMIIRTVNEGA